MKREVQLEAGQQSKKEQQVDHAAAQHSLIPVQVWVREGGTVGGLPTVQAGWGMLVHPGCTVCQAWLPTTKHTCHPCALNSDVKILKLTCYRTARCRRCGSQSPAPPPGGASNNNAD